MDFFAKSAWIRPICCSPSNWIDAIAVRAVVHWVIWNALNPLLLNCRLQTTAAVGLKKMGKGAKCRHAINVKGYEGKSGHSLQSEFYIWMEIIQAQTATVGHYIGPFQWICLGIMEEKRWQLNGYEWDRLKECSLHYHFSYSPVYIIRPFCI
jgi:hypothetical protein